MTLRPRFLIAAGLAIEAAIAAAVVFVISATNDSDTPAAPDRDGPFYLEATVLIVESELKPAIKISVRSWFRDSRHFRSETTRVAGDEVPSTTTIVADGDYVWIDNSRTSTYHRVTPTEPLEDGPPVFSSASVGRVLFSSDVDELLADLVSSGDPAMRSERFARVSGRARILGIETVIIEHGPTWRVSGSTVTSSGVVERTESWGGTARIWLDPRTMFVLRNEREETEGGTLAQVTRLVWSPGFPEDTFRYSPPPGKTLDENESLRFD